jgi:hypothetical protein
MGYTNVNQMYSGTKRQLHVAVVPQPVIPAQMTYEQRLGDLEHEDKRVRAVGVTNADLTKILLDYQKKAGAPAAPLPTNLTGFNVNQIDMHTTVFSWNPQPNCTYNLNIYDQAPVAVAGLTQPQYVHKTAYTHPPGTQVKFVAFATNSDGKEGPRDNGFYSPIPFNPVPVLIPPEPELSIHAQMAHSVILAMKCDNAAGTLYWFITAEQANVPVAIALTDGKWVWNDTDDIFQGLNFPCAVTVSASYSVNGENRSPNSNEVLLRLIPPEPIVTGACTLTAEVTTDGRTKIVAKKTPKYAKSLWISFSGYKNLLLYEDKTVTAGQSYTQYWDYDNPAINSLSYPIYINVYACNTVEFSSIGLGPASNQKVIKPFEGKILPAPDVFVTKDSDERCRLEFADIPGAVNSWWVDAVFYTRNKLPRIPPALDIEFWDYSNPPQPEPNYPCKGYIVCARDEAGKYLGERSNLVTIPPRVGDLGSGLPAPVVTAGLNSSTNISLSWPVVVGAKAYALFYGNATTPDVVVTQNSYGWVYENTTAYTYPLSFIVRAVSTLPYSTVTQGKPSTVVYIPGPSGTTTTTQLGAPLLTLGVATTTSVSITWVGITGAKSYALFKGVETAPFFITTGPSFTWVYNAYAGVTYPFFFKVKALPGLTYDANTAGFVSQSVTILPKAPASVLFAPEVSTTSTATGITLNWNNSYASGTTFDVYAAIATGGLSKLSTVPDVNNPSYTFVYTSVSAASYPVYLYVSAKDASGNVSYGSNNVIIETMPTTQSLGPLTNLSVTQGPTQAPSFTVSWSQVSGAGSYRVDYGGNITVVNTTTYTGTIPTASIGSKTVTVTPQVAATGNTKVPATDGIPAQRTFDYTLFGLIMNTRAALPPPAATVSSSTNQDLTLTWAVIPNASSYNVSVVDGAVYADVVPTVVSNIATKTLPIATTTGTLTITAANSAIVSPPQTLAFNKAVVTMPTVPTVTGGSFNASTLTLSWTAVSSTPGVSYNTYVAVGVATDATAALANISNNTATNCSVVGLPNVLAGATYTATVVATAPGYTNSTPYSFTFFYPAPLATPSGFAYDSVTNVLSWVAVPNATANYNWSIARASAPTIPVQANGDWASNNIPATAMPVNPFVTNTSYILSLNAKSTATALASPVATYTFLYKPIPVTPTGVTAVVNSATSITFSWTPSPGAIMYLLRLSPGATPTDIPVYGQVGTYTHTASPLPYPSTTAIPFQLFASAEPESYGQLYSAAASGTFAPVVSSEYVVVIAMGQSNMAGNYPTYSNAVNPAIDTTNPRIVQMNLANTAMSTANDPVITGGSANGGVCPAMFFCKGMLATLPTSSKILLIHYAVNGMGLVNSGWYPYDTNDVFGYPVTYGDNYRASQALVASTLAGAKALPSTIPITFRAGAIIWLQGESDRLAASGPTGAIYAAGLYALIAKYRLFLSSLTPTVLGASNIPFIVGSTVPDDQGYISDTNGIRTVHATIASNVPYTAFAPSQTGMAAGLHYTNVGYRAMGTSMANVLGAAIANAAPTTAYTLPSVPSPTATISAGGMITISPPAGETVIGYRFQQRASTALAWPTTISTGSTGPTIQAVGGQDTRVAILTKTGTSAWVSAVLEVTVPVKYATYTIPQTAGSYVLNASVLSWNDSSGNTPARNLITGTTVATQAKVCPSGVFIVGSTPPIVYKTSTASIGFWDVSGARMLPLVTTGNGASYTKMALFMFVDLGGFTNVISTMGSGPNSIGLVWRYGPAPLPANAFYTSSQPSFAVDVTTTFTPVVNAPYALYITYDNTNKTQVLYVNRVPGAALSTYSGTVNSPMLVDAPTGIMTLPGGGNGIIGEILEANTWSVALTAAQVQQHFNGLKTTYPGWGGLM